MATLRTCDAVEILLTSVSLKGLRTGSPSFVLCRSVEARKNAEAQIEQQYGPYRCLFRSPLP